MPAFVGAARLGVDAIELDAHLTADGELVVLHDPTLERTTDGAGAVAEMRLAEIQKRNAAARRLDCRRAPPPSLREVFAALAPTPLLLVVELKDFRPRAAAAAAALVGLLDDFPGLGARVIVGGFDGAIAAAFARARRSAKDPATRATATAASVTEARILISLGVLRLDFLWPTKSRALLIPPRGGGCGLVTRNIVARAHRRGQAIWHWTINDAPTMRKIAQVGGDGIITDRPDLGREVLRELGCELPPPLDLPAAN